MKTFVLATALLASTLASAQGIRIASKPAEHRVDITIDGQPFTSYLWNTNQRKPVLYPLIAPDGTTVTRGYPFKPLPGERVDHPHHAGLWFNYGNANDLDYWNNSDAIKPEERPKYGTILHEKVLLARSGKDSGELDTESLWYPGGEPKPKPGTQPVLRQRTRYVFSRVTVDGQPARALDLVVTLTALSPVTFHDDKEGMLGMRVAQFLESPNEKSGIFFDANGKPTTVNGASPGATGVYRSSEGRTGDAVWGTRGSWCVLTGQTTDKKTETIAILDHSLNPGSPTYWHARGYGLFAANPLGAHIFDPTVAPFNLTLDKGKSATFRYRILILSSPITDKAMNDQESAFVKLYH